MSILNASAGLTPRKPRLVGIEEPVMLSFHLKVRASQHITRITIGFLRSETQRTLWLIEEKCGYTLQQDVLTELSHARY